MAAEPRWEQRWRGTFFKVMELHDFPWDLQQMEIIVRLPRRQDMGRMLQKMRVTSAYQDDSEFKDWVRRHGHRRVLPHHSPAVPRFAGARRHVLRVGRSDKAVPSGL